MKTYLRCVWANKFTLVGFLCILAFTLRLVLFRYGWRSYEWEDFIWVYTVTIGIFLLIGTLFGFQTLDVYHHTLRAGIQLSEEYAGGWSYCYMSGFRLAQRDLLRQREEETAR